MSSVYRTPDPFFDWSRASLSQARLEIFARARNAAGALWMNKDRQPPYPLDVIGFRVPNPGETVLSTSGTLVYTVGAKGLSGMGKKKYPFQLDEEVLGSIPVEERMRHVGCRFILMPPNKCLNDDAEPFDSSSYLETAKEKEEESLMTRTVFVRQYSKIAILAILTDRRNKIESQIRQAQEANLQELAVLAGRASSSVEGLAGLEGNDGTEFAVRLVPSKAFRAAQDAISDLDRKIQAIGAVQGDSLEFNETDAESFFEAVEPLPKLRFVLKAQ